MSMAAADRARIAQSARGWLGTPYVHQASAKGAGADCLGLVRGVWREVIGAEPEAAPAYTADWAEPEGREVLMSVALRHMRPAQEALEIGQVLLFRMRSGSIAKHLGLVVAAGATPRFVHAYSGHGVVESALSRPWVRRIAARFELPCGNQERES